MLRLDRNDPLDRMILQELEGEPVLADAWMNAMDELAEEEDWDCEQFLRERGLRVDDVLREAWAYRDDFYTRLSEWKIPADNRFKMCAALYSQAIQSPAPKLKRIFCEILSDMGFLLDTPQETTDDEDKVLYDEQIIWQYFNSCQERDRLLDILNLRTKLSELFSEITKENRNPKLTADYDTKRSYEIAKCLTELFDLPQKASADILMDNIASFIQTAAGSPKLKSIEPLFLFRALTKHQSRTCTVSGLNIRLSALWKQDVQQTDRDNGRNFKQFGLNLRFFQELCQIYQNDSTVNFPLCWYGLDQITVLGDFYREYIAPEWKYLAKKEYELPFIPVIDELVDDALFCCFEDSVSANVFLQNGNITERELSKFQEGGDSPRGRVLDKLSDYMNEHIVELAIQASQADAKKTMALCRNILEWSNPRLQPKSPQEAELYLAAINSGLMDCQNWLANYYLTQAGRALLGEPVETLELPE